MARGDLTSPIPYEDRDANGNVICQFFVFFNDTNQANLTLTSITAYNVQGSGLTNIQIARADGVIKTFPLPTSGKKATLNVLDPQGVPTTIQAYSATVSQSQMNAQGFFVAQDVVGSSYTVF